MSLATRCPQCSTLFRVSASQLQVHDGKVRCGQCDHVFSGIDHLTAADSLAWQNASLQAPTSKPQVAGDSTAQATGQPSFLSDGAAKPATKATPRPAWVMPVAAGLVVCLLLQLGWWQRHRIAQHAQWAQNAIANANPGVQAAFSLSPSAAMAVEGSGLHNLDEQHLRLDLTLKNKSTLPSRWPVLRVELLDTQGLPLASRHIGPAQYEHRDHGTAKASGLVNAGQTVEVLAYLNLARLIEQLPEAAATGFRVSLLDSTSAGAND